MKKRDLLRRIAKQAKLCGVEWVLHRQGSNHEIWTLGGEKIPVPRHTELGEDLAGSIFKECEPKLGERWWK